MTVDDTYTTDFNLFQNSGKIKGIRFAYKCFLAMWKPLTTGFENIFTDKKTTASLRTKAQGILKKAKITSISLFGLLVPRCAGNDNTSNWNIWKRGVDALRS